MPIASKSGMTPSKCSPYKFGSLVALSCTTVVVGTHSRRQTGTRLWAAPTSSRLQRAPNHHAHESRSPTGGILEISLGKSVSASESDPIVVVGSMRPRSSLTMLSSRTGWDKKWSRSRDFSPEGEERGQR